MPPFLMNFFQHPAFLGVLAAVAIPPIIEWLLRRRRKRIPWAAMRFLLDSERPQKIKMQDRILMILRMLVIFWIVLAIARPLVRPEDVISVDADERSVVMLFDATYSNAQRVGNSSAFEHAKRMANDILDGMPEGVEVTLASMGHTLKEIQPWSNDKGLIREKIENLPISHGSAGLAPGIDWALEKVKDKTKSGEPIKVMVFVFSDMQVKTWTKDEGAGGEKVAGKSLRGLFPQLIQNSQVFIAGTGGTDATNIFITEFAPVDKVLSVGVTTEFRVKIETSGVSGSIPARLTLYVNDEKRHFESFDVPAEGIERLIPYKVLSDGEQVIRVVLEGDDSPLDNERLYLAEVPEAMRVLVLDDDGSSAPHERSTVFWEYAVAPPGKPGREPVSAFTVKTCDWGEAQKENFGDYGAVVLGNIKNPEPGLVSRLMFYVSEGGCLVTFAGEGIDPYPYQKLWKDGESVLPVPIKDIRDASGNNSPKLVFGNEKSGAEFDVSVKKIRELGAPKQGKGVEKTITLVTTESGKKLVVGRKFGQGQSIIIALDPGLTWSTLPLAMDYPVLVQDLLRHILGDPNRFVNVNVGDEFSQPVLISTQHLLLKTPDGRKVRLTPQESKGQDLPRVVYDDTDVQGLYQLEAPPGVLARKRFVVNLNPDEGEMDMWSEGEFRDEIAKNVIFLKPNDNLVKKMKSMTTMREFAGLILFMVLFLMLVESFLAMRFGLRKGV